MTVVKLGIALARKTNTLFSTQKPIGYIMTNMSLRSLSTMEITKNISLISDKKINAKLTNQMEILPTQNKPLVVMLAWLLAKRKHVNKYAQIYIDRGFDVLNVSITPWQLLWPTKGTQLVAGDVLKFIHTNNTYSPLIVHAFSVGAYVWGEVLVKMAAEIPEYQPVIDRVIGQVFDSSADITEIPVGFPIAVFPKNQVMQAALRQYILYHMKTFDKVATCHYLRSSQMFHTNIIKSPALFFLSKTDPIGAEKSNLRARESWESMGIDVTWKCWDRSPHVGHFHKHPEEYLAYVNNFLDKVYYGSQTEKVQAKAKL